MLLASSVALAAPVAYFVVKDGAPDTFERQVDEAFGAWRNVPATSLKIEKNPNATTRFRWGGEAEIGFNPDVATRTLETTEGTITRTEVQVNPEQPVDLPSALLVETGLRLGVALEPGIDGKRAITDADIAALRARYSQNGDMNGDGRVDIDDLELFAAQYGKRGERLAGDFNGDGVVDGKDLEILRANYSYGGDPQTPPPAEPAPATPPAPDSPPVPGTPNPTPPAAPPINPTPPANPSPPTAPPTNPTTPTPPAPTPPSPPPSGP
jgi:hypothetical protein